MKTKLFCCYFFFYCFLGLVGENWRGSELQAQDLWDEDTPFFFAKKNPPSRARPPVLLPLGSIVYLSFETDFNWSYSTGAATRPPATTARRFTRAFREGRGGNFAAALNPSAAQQTVPLPELFSFLPPGARSQPSKPLSIISHLQASGKLAATLIDYDASNETYLIQAERVVSLNDKEQERLLLQGKINAAALGIQADIQTGAERARPLEVPAYQVAELVVYYQTFPDSPVLRETDFNALNLSPTNALTPAGQAEVEDGYRRGNDLTEAKKKELYLRYLNRLLLRSGL